MRRILIILLTSALLLYGCAGGQAGPQGGQPNQSGNIKQCPASCNDNNPCTNDYCNASTNFECRHDAIKNCYSNDEYHFSVTYPEGWTVSGFPLVTVVFVGPSEDNITSNCNIGEESVGGTTLGEYADIVKNHYTERYGNDYSLLSESNITVNGLQGYEITSTIKKTDYVQESKRAVFIKDQTVHVITCVASTSTFSKSEPDFDSIISSFKFYD